MFSFFKKKMEAPGKGLPAGVFAGISGKQKYCICYVLLLAGGGNQKNTSAETAAVDVFCATLGFTRHAATEYFAWYAGTLIDRPEELIARSLSCLDTAQKEAIIRLVYLMLKRVPARRLEKALAVMRILARIGISEDGFITVIKSDEASARTPQVLPLDATRGIPYSLN